MATDSAKHAAHPREHPGILVRDYRLRRGWTQGELGLSMDISKQRISDVERGREWPTLDWLLRCAVALGMPFAELAPWTAAEDLPARTLTMRLRGPGRAEAGSDADAALLAEIAGSSSAIMPLGELLALADGHGVAVLFLPSFVGEIRNPKSQIRKG